MGPFFYVTSFWAGRGTEHFNPHYLSAFFFFPLSWSWMNEWVLLWVALPDDFPWKHCTPSLSLKSSMWDVWECKTWIPPFTHLLVNFIMESGFMNRTISCFCFLRQVKLFCVNLILNRLPSLYYLQCTSAYCVLLCLRWGVQTLSKHVIHRRTCDLLIVYFVCVRTGFQHCTKIWLPC